MYVWLRRPGKAHSQSKWPGINIEKKEWNVSGQLRNYTTHWLKKRLFDVREMGLRETEFKSDHCSGNLCCTIVLPHLYEISLYWL